MSSRIVYINGKYLPIEQAQVSVLDRGFLFGDGVYEVIPAYGGHLLRLAEHLQRLQNSLDAIRLINPLTHQQWIEILEALLKKNQGRDQSVYLQVTRGVAQQRDHSFPDEVLPTVFVMVNPLHAQSKDELAKGVMAITVDDNRWRACYIKATALLANTLLRQQATDAGAAEAILIRDGYVTEGAASNVFIVDKNSLITPPIGPNLLTGVTRDLVLEQADQAGITCQQADISEDQLNGADEIWLTSSGKEIQPVISLNGSPVGNGQAGPIWHTMIDIFQQYKDQLRQGHE
ncbi:MAG: D-amino acid aminotransferase [Gammaproteobacteria bacterium]|nr:D-amino acid aminotransferase [Gammaproteobacteria bacterium]